MGPVGATGGVGPAGPVGPVGATGAVGPMGPKGDTGAPGVAGPVGPAGPVGAPGPVGASGQSCWDRNGNGRGDAEEDLNRDGSVNALDCIGPQGPAGAPGAAGPSGPVGPAGPIGPVGPAGAPGAAGTAGRNGQSCWDRNGNGVGDANEDYNRDGQVNVLDCLGPAGPAGPAGATGATGPVGPQGPAGPAGSGGGFTLQRLSNTSGFDASLVKTVDVVCPAGKKVVGGGADINSSQPNDTKLSVQDSFPLSDNAWRVVAVKDSSCNCSDYPWGVTVWAICVDAR